MKNNSPIDHNYKFSLPKNELIGLTAFKNTLEKLFFSEIDLTYKQTNNKCHFFINLKCNFNLINGLYQIKNSNWGGLSRKNAQFGNSQFEFIVHDFQEKNDLKISIKEIAIHFNDTSVFISKLLGLHIADELCAILDTLTDNYIHITKGLSSVPNEIFIPIIEEATINHVECSKKTKYKKDYYYKFWGLYFPSEENPDPIIFDLISKTIIENDFSMKGVIKL